MAAAAVSRATSKGTTFRGEPEGTVEPSTTSSKRQPLLPAPSSTDSRKPNKPSFVRRGSKGRSPSKKRSQDAGEERPASGWKHLRAAVYAGNHSDTRQPQTDQTEEQDALAADCIGSLGNFLEAAKSGDTTKMVETIAPREWPIDYCKPSSGTPRTPKSLLSPRTPRPPAGSPTSPFRPGQPRPQLGGKRLTPGPRRVVDRLGDSTSRTRVASGRHKQLSAMIPSNTDGAAKPMVSPTSTPRSQSHFDSKHSASPGTSAANLPHSDGLHAFPAPPAESQQTSATEDRIMERGRWHTHSSREAAKAAQANAGIMACIRSMTKPSTMDDSSSLITRQAGYMNSLRGDTRGHKKYDTNFTPAFLGGATIAKPRAEQHALLVAIDAMQDDVFTNSAVQAEQTMLAQRLEDLRKGGLKMGEGMSQADKRRLYGNEGMPPTPHVLKKFGNGSKPQTGAQKRSTQFGVDMEVLLELVDPQLTGKVSKDVLVPLMFWLGLTRRRSAALACLDIAFGPGDIDTAVLASMCEHMEVQVRLVDGLRQMARKESLEQLCEYMTEHNIIRQWFNSMPKDPHGHVDIAEVQNLFARMEVTEDRQSFFRYLRHEMHRGSFNVPAPGTAGVTRGTSGADSGTASGPTPRTFGISEFACMLCRCTITWCLHRTIMLINPAAPYDLNGTESGFGGEAGASDIPESSDKTDMALRWTQLQRKITVSLLVNHRFWGRESNRVLMSMRQSGANVGEELSEEQWISLFQRVRAQGMASTLPVGEEADDPDFLRRKTEHEEFED